MGEQIPSWAIGYTTGYSEKVLDFVRKGYEQGLSTVEMAKQANKLGFKTKTGAKFSNSTISGLAIANGIGRRHSRRTGYTKGGGRKAGRHDVESDPVEVMEDIITSSLSKKTKRLLIKALAKGL